MKSCTSLLLPLLFVALPCPALLAAQNNDDSPVKSTSQSRPAKNDVELRFWLESMIWHHRYSNSEIRSVLGLSDEAITAAQTKFEIFARTKPDRAPGSPLLVRPYPGGRHPRIGFRDGAVDPQRETKVSIFTPWDDASYVVADVPEAIWSNLGLTYLAHTHVPTVWTKQNVELEKLEWQRRIDGSLFHEQKLPNGIVFTTKAIPDRAAVWFEMSLTNGTKETLSDLRVQNCVMLAYAKGFEQQTNDNKLLAAAKTPGSPYVTVHNADRTRWIISAWEPLHRPWANPPCPCLHSDPKFPDCAPGQTRYVRGLVTFHEGANIEEKFKQLDKLGWRDNAPPESAENARKRQARIAQRRAGLQIMCHRGAVEFAHENTLEAYRATFELGADGNEIDIRETKDGVLVCFHDDMLDQILAAYGDVSDYTWNELRQFSFRRPGKFGEHTRIPTLAEVFALHRDHAGLMHLDIKRPGLDHKIAQLLDAFDLWDHVMIAPDEHGAVIVQDPRYKPLKYKTQLYIDHRDVDAREIEKALKLDGTALIVDDPRGALIASSRPTKADSDQPVTPEKTGPHKENPPSDRRQFYDIWTETLAVGTKAEPPPPGNDSAARLATLPIMLRAGTAQMFADEPSEYVRENANVFPALEDVVRYRALHPDWRSHDLDGAEALRALVAHKAPRAVDIARECLWRDDPALDAVRDPQFNNPRSWHDWRIKNIVFPLLESLPGEKTEQLCRDYLALSDDEAKRIGPPQFDAASKTLLTISPTEKTALELLNDKRPAVRNRAIKVCLHHADQPWATSALKKAAPHAINYVVPTRE
jgi:hypothetical protein